MAEDNLYYPIKNCKGAKIIGEERKEQWGIINEKGRVISKRTHKSLEQITSLITLDILSIHTSIQAIEIVYLSKVDDRPKIKVRDEFRTLLASEESDHISEYLTHFLSKEVPGRYRLVRLPDKKL
ncbi:MAG: hypothetical protein QG644_85 [Patescibacteria group bacterium]|nr:hypothetical protein [Patescibacteria group bacterium]